MSRPRPTDAELEISKALRGIAEGLDEVLEKLAGERVGFLLITVPLGKPECNAQYVANVERPQAIDMMQKLLDRWATGLPTPAAHDLGRLS